MLYVEGARSYFMGDANTHDKIGMVCHAFSPQTHTRLRTHYDAGCSLCTETTTLAVTPYFLYSLRQPLVLHNM